MPTKLASHGEADSYLKTIHARRANYFIYAYHVRVEKIKPHTMYALKVFIKRCVAMQKSIIRDLPSIQAKKGL